MTESTQRSKRLEPQSLALYKQHASAYELGRANSGAVFTYPVLALILATSTSLGVRNPVLCTILVSLLFITAGIRFYLYLKFDELYKRSEERLIRILFSLVTLHSLAFGLIVAGIFGFYGVSSESALAMLFAAVAVVAATRSLSSRLYFQTTFLICMMFPLMLLVLWKMGVEGAGFAISIVIFVAFQIREGRVSHETFERFITEQFQNIRDKDELQNQIDERSQAESALVESEQRYRDLFENSSELILTVDLKGHVQFANNALKNKLNYSDKDLSKLRFEKLFPVEEIRRCVRASRRLLEGKEVGALETRLISKDGVIVPVEATATISYKNGKPVALNNMFHDISERAYTEQIAFEYSKNLERQLLQSQKMSAIGQLTSGIAHDFNNILTGILGYAELALGESQADSDLHVYLNEIVATSERAAGLVRQLLDKSRPTDSQERLVDVVELVTDLASLLQASAHSYVDIQVDCRNDIGKLRADPTLIHQLLLNLCTNAIWAIGETPGKLKIQLENFDVREPEGDKDDALAIGRYVKISVSDDGVGMSAELIRRIYDPFFTTRDIDEGSGMGLSIVHTIVQRLEGKIEVESTEGVGTTFCVYLACSTLLQKLSDDTVVINAPGTERLLLVDDELSNVQLIKLKLEKLGYTVVGESDPKIALKTFSEDTQGFDLVLTDFTMPGMTGNDLARAMQKINPGQPIVLFTGYTPSISKNDIQAGGIYKVLAKPVSIEILSSTIRDAISEAEEKGKLSANL